MPYYICENRPTSKAIIHLDDCGHCNHGRGRSRGPVAKNSRWHGPFKTLENARRLAANLQQRDTRDCYWCMRWRSQ